MRDVVLCRGPSRFTDSSPAPGPIPDPSRSKQIVARGRTSVSAAVDEDVGENKKRTEAAKKASEDKAMKTTVPTIDSTAQRTTKPMKQGRKHCRGCQ